jgi:CheY-like chemotaxis protein
MSAAPVEDPRPGTGLPTVLVVEDEVLIRLMIANEIRAAGFNVIEATNAHEALAVLNTPTQVDILMTDIRMPGPMDGLKLATRVRSIWPQVKIIVASAYAPDALAPGIKDTFIGKPYDPGRVIQRIRTLLESHGQ